MQDKFNKNKEVGNSGEDLAAEYLQKQGFRIIARNVRYKTGEIDIVAKKGDDLHFVEVRTRTDPSFLPPIETITKPKQEKLKKTAQLYLKDARNGFKCNNLPPCCFSVIGIDYASGTPQIECMLDAFY